ncbi:MAG TPA: GNAT family N-acetyltransferase [Pirellulaceae bacterium]|nr:GNAT family N-acetyltransferase [Pirellulaceae bacterium]
MSDPPALVHGLPDDPRAMLDLLAQSWPQPERSLQYQSLAMALAGGSRDSFVCVRALCGDALVGVVLAQQLPGRTAAVYPPQTTDASPADLSTQLLDALKESLHTGGIVLAQSLLSLDQAEDEARLAAAGFTGAATLLYMASDGVVFPDRPPISELALEPATLKNEPRLQQVIEATYEATLDCPLLNGLRTTDDVVAGYRAVGTYRPELWLMARCGDRDVGCLLLADHPDEGNLELVYLGVLPAARGRGFGLALARHALWLAQQLARERVVLAVDAANAPAIRQYEAAGFFGFDQRLVMIKTL